MDNIGRVITDFYCNGFFGRDYDLTGAVIIGEGDDWLVIRKTDGTLAFTDFIGWDKEEHLDKWCN